MQFRAVFKDATYQSLFEERGYFAIPLLSEDEVRLLLNVFNEVAPEKSENFYATIDINDIEYRRRVQECADKILTPKYAGLFIQYYPLIYNFIVKLPGENTRIELHNDHTHVDETRFRSVNMWMPLVDTNDLNGVLYVLPGSHKFPCPPRGFFMPYPYGNYQHVAKPYLEKIPMRAGEAIFYSNRLLHCSDPNISETVRPALITALLPEEAQPIIHFMHEGLPPGKVEVFELSREFYLTFDRTQRPTSAKSLGVIDYFPLEITAEQFASMLEQRVKENRINVV